MLDYSDLLEKRCYQLIVSWLSMSTGIMLFVWALILKAHVKIHGYAQGSVEAFDYFAGHCWAVM